MKLIFGQYDSIYTIFSTIEKVPNEKELSIYIDEKNEFFANIWWWKQLVTLIQRKELKVKFIIYYQKSYSFYEQLWVNHLIEKKQNVQQIWSSVLWKLSFAWDVHTRLLHKKNYFSYTLMVVEALALIYVVYFFYTLISPSATVLIRSSYTIDQLVYNYRIYPESRKEELQYSSHISLTYKTWAVEFKEAISSKVSNIKYFWNPSRGDIKIQNYWNKEYSLVANTRFVSADGIVFKTLNWISIPAAQGDTPSEVITAVEAQMEDESWQVVWQKWNITKDTQLLVRNLNDSYALKLVTAYPINDFAWGTTDATGSVQVEDIDAMRNRLDTVVHNNIKKYVQDSLVQDNSRIVLNFDEFYKVENKQFIANANPWDNVNEFEWTVTWRIVYRYIDRQEYQQAVRKYLEQRTSENIKVIEIDRPSTMVLTKYDMNWYSLMPIQTDVVRGYDFDKDINWIKSEILSKIIGKTKAEAEAIVLWYEEIDFVLIKLSPPWYEAIPTLKSRIDIKLEK